MAHARWPAHALLIALVLAIVTPVAAEERMSGVVLAIVTDDVDRGNLFRVKVKFATLPDNARPHEAWAHVMIPFVPVADFSALPQKDDEVLVTFMYGDPDKPVILGRIWKGQLPRRR